MRTEIDLKEPKLDKIHNGMEIHYLKMIYRMQKIYAQKIPWCEPKLEKMKKPNFKINMNSFTLAI